MNTNRPRLVQTLSSPGDSGACIQAMVTAETIRSHAPNPLPVPFQRMETEGNNERDVTARIPAPLCNDIESKDTGNEGTLMMKQLF
jgi:hypothetical protein